MLTESGEMNMQSRSCFAGILCTCLFCALIGCDAKKRDDYALGDCPPDDAGGASNVVCIGVNALTTDSVIKCRVSNEAINHLMWCDRSHPERYITITVTEDNITITGTEDIGEGTIREIEAALRGRSEMDIDGVRIRATTEAYYLDGCLLALTWIGNLGNYYDVRMRTYLPCGTADETADDLSAIYHSSTRYSKRDDRTFKRVHDVMLRRANLDWTLEVFGDSRTEGGGKYILSCSDGSILPESEYGPGWDMYWYLDF